MQITVRKVQSAILVLVMVCNAMLQSVSVFGDDSPLSGEITDQSIVMADQPGEEFEQTLQLTEIGLEKIDGGGIEDPFLLEVETEEPAEQTLQLEQIEFEEMDERWFEDQFPPIIETELVYREKQEDGSIREIIDNKNGTYTTRVYWEVDQPANVAAQPLENMEIAPTAVLYPSLSPTGSFYLNTRDYMRFQTNITSALAMNNGYTFWGFNITGPLHIQNSTTESGNYTYLDLYAVGAGTYKVVFELGYNGPQTESPPAYLYISDPYRINEQITMTTPMTIGQTQIADSNIKRSENIGGWSFVLSTVWSSSNPSVATIDANGKITALAPGTTTITARGNSLGESYFGKHEASRTLTVNKVAVTNVTVSGPNSVNVGNTIALSSAITPANATNTARTWASSNTSVATVNAAGVVTGVSSGTANITATVDGRISNAHGVTVIQPPTSVTVTPSTSTLSVGQAVTLRAAVNPAGASQAVTWSSNNTGIVTVNASGLVTAVGKGTAVITAKTADGTRSGTASITVIQPVTGVTVTPTAGTVNVGGTINLTATVVPGTANNQNVTWNSSDNSIATVNSTGVVTGVGAGTVTITVTTVDGGKTATSRITVNRPVDSVSVNPSNGTISIGDSIPLTATILPSDAVNKNVNWSSSDTEVATVGSTGVVTGVGKGTATITVTTVDGGKTATSLITVLKPVDSVAVTPKTALIWPGETTTLSAAISPADASNLGVSWSSSNPGVAVVDANGVVTGVDSGSATVTVATNDGNKTDTSVITVAIPVTGVEVSPKVLETEVGETLHLSAEVLPVNATEPSLLWNSSDPAVLTVDAVGNITGQSAGSAIITVTTVDGNYQDTTSVVVYPASVIITNLQELINVRNDLNARYRLGNDIDVNNTYLTSLGTVQTPFTGVFDGRGYTIRNLQIYRTTVNAGLFGYVNGGTIRNLTLENLVVEGANNTGAIAGSAENSSIYNCHIIGSGSVKGGANVGGIVGVRTDGDFYLNSNGMSVEGLRNAGGLIGNNSGDIQLSYATGAVTGSGNIGGMIGISTSGTVTESYATGRVTSDANSSGGLIGRLDGGSLQNSFAYGRVRNTASYAGGLIGYQGSASVSYCYSVGKPMGAGRVDGLIGGGLDINPYKSYFDSDTTGIAGSRIWARTTQEMFQKSNYEEWDMNSIWDIDDGFGYPYLRDLPKPVLNLTEDPYLITSPQELIDIRNDLNGEYQLANDIDMAGISYNPIGEVNLQPFTGSLDGKGHTIRNLTINGTINTGLFARTENAALKNIILEDVNITGTNNTGALIGTMNGGAVENCLITGAGQVQGAAYVGGMIGIRNGGIFTGNAAEVNVVADRGGAGGLIGSNSSGEINKCYATGDVIGMGNTGGLIGISEDGRISESYATGDITVTSTVAAGGLIGRLNGGSLSNTFATGNVVSSPNYNGGLLGYQEGGTTVENSFAIGSVDTGTRIGGLFGVDVGGIISCYFNSDTTGIMTPITQARTTAEMKQAATYIGWDFTTIWTIQEGAGYPSLRNLPVPTVLYQMKVIEELDSFVQEKTVADEEEETTDWDTQEDDDNSYEDDDNRTGEIEENDDQFLSEFEPEEQEVEQEIKLELEFQEMYANLLGKGETKIDFIEYLIY